MKKLFFILALSGVVLTSCDPQKAEGEFEVNNPNPETLINDATFAQFDGQKNQETGEITYTPSETGNYIQYNFPGVAAVTVYYIKNDVEKVLSYGRSGGMFYYMPSRGSDPVQTLYFSYYNADGEKVVTEKQFTLQVAQALDPAVKVLVSNNGVKKWKWMPTNVNSGAVWGNGGYLAGPQAGGLDIEGAWWGCGVDDGDCPDTFSGQAQHAGSRYNEIKGECFALSYMEFNEDGSLTAYSNEGVKINEGTFAITNYDKNQITDNSNNSRGTLQTSAGAILWPFAINTGGEMPEQFEIGYLDEGRMVLAYAKPGTGGWGESTWWSFMSDDDPNGILASHDWHWRPTTVNGGAVWGNGGYAAGSQNGLGGIEGGWWGCGVNDGDCDATFAGQMQHAGAAYVAGEEYAASKMVFNEDEASITVFDKDGNQIRQGSYAVDMTPNAANFSLGTLETSEGTILWPFAINTGGKMPTKFDIGYLGTDAMILIYAEPGTGGWGESTWWSFGKSTTSE